MHQQMVYTCTCTSHLIYDLYASDCIHRSFTDVSQIIFYIIIDSCVFTTYGSSTCMSALSGSGGFLAGVAAAALVATLIIVIRLDNYCQYYGLARFQDGGSNQCISVFTAISSPGNEY